MFNYKYLIIGGGMTADSATKGIRELDQSGTIGIIGDESDPPYDRPPLSKKLWKGTPFESIWRKTAGRNVTLHLGRHVVELDAVHHQVSDDQGDVYSYKKLLLATGGTPRRLDFGPFPLPNTQFPLPNPQPLTPNTQPPTPNTQPPTPNTQSDIIYFRTVADYRRLRSIVLPEPSDSTLRTPHSALPIGVIGGGFIGSEVAAAIRMSGREVVMVMPDAALCARIFPADLARYVTDYCAAKGIQILAEDSVIGVSREGEQLTMKTRSGRQIEVAAVVAGIGIIPNVALAIQAGLDVGNGIMVDEFLCTDDPDIYAAGDVAEFYSPELGKRTRLEHEACANSMGKHAGRNMAGAGVSWHHLPFFYSDVFELGYEAIGETDSRLDVFADWRIPPQLATRNSQLETPLPKGVIYYLKDHRIRGVLLWNVWDKVPVARELIAQPGPFGPEDLKGRIS